MQFFKTIGNQQLAPWSKNQIQVLEAPKEHIQDDLDLQVVICFSSWKASNTIRKSHLAF